MRARTAGQLRVGEAESGVSRMWMSFCERDCREGGQCAVCAVEGMLVCQ